MVCSSVFADQEKPTQQGVISVEKDVRDIRASYQKCISDADGVNSEIMDCIYGEIDFHDKRLNKAYKELSAYFVDDHKKKLIETQRQWLALAKSDKALTLFIYGEGTAAEMVSEEVYLRNLINRANQLEDWAIAAKEYLN